MSEQGEPSEKDRSGTAGDEGPPGRVTGLLDRARWWLSAPAFRKAFYYFERIEKRLDGIEIAEDLLRHELEAVRKVQAALVAEKEGIEGHLGALQEAYERCTHNLDLSQRFQRTLIRDHKSLEGHTAALQAGFERLAVSSDEVLSLLSFLITDVANLQSGASGIFDGQRPMETASAKNRVFSSLSTWVSISTPRPLVPEADSPLGSSRPVDAVRGTLAAVVVGWNGESSVGACLESLLSQSRELDILVVDNASEDRSLAIAREIARGATADGRRVEVLENPTNEGYVAGANRGIVHLLERDRPPEVVLLLNQDATVEPEAASSLMRLFEEEPAAGVAGCKIFFPDGRTLQHAGGVLERPRMLVHHRGHHSQDGPGLFDTREEVDFITGAAMAVRSKCIEEVGLFDVLLSPGYYEDVEYCQRARKHGWKTLYCPDAAVRHEESSSFSDPFTRQTLSHRNRILFALKLMSPEVFIRELVPAEGAQLDACDQFDELRVLATAYGQTLLRIVDSESSSLSSGTTGPGEAVIVAIAGLRRKAIARLDSLLRSGAAKAVSG